MAHNNPLISGYEKRTALQIRVAQQQPLLYFAAITPPAFLETAIAKIELHCEFVRTIHMVCVAGRRPPAQ
jgi:hypothetical protein